MKSRLKCSDNLKYLKTLPDNSIDSCVTDPPYFIGFMGNGWDKVNGRQSMIDKFLPTFKEIYRVLKPGAHATVFALPRTSHWTGMLLEDAGFELRDHISWVFGSGFPKSHNIGKSIDKLNGVKSKVVGVGKSGATRNQLKGIGENYDIVQAQNEYNGWGTGLKPAHEVIWLVRKPLSEKTIVGNVLKHGTGGLNIDASRAGTEGGEKIVPKPYNGDNNIYKMNVGGSGKKEKLPNTGRFPANLILECNCSTKPTTQTTTKQQTNKTGVGGDKGHAGKRPEKQVKHEDTTQGQHEANCPCKTLDDQSGTSKSGKAGIHKVENQVNRFDAYADKNWEGGNKVRKDYAFVRHGDKGGASRYFAQIHEEGCPCRTLDDQSGVTSQGHWAKSKVTGYGKNVEYKGVGTKDKEKGGASRYFAQIEDNVDKATPFFYCPKVSTKERNMGDAKNTHPTVKPIKLLKYLIKLITPPKGIVLDPFAGSGSTLIAAKQEGFKYVGIELDKKYIKIARKRLKAVK